MSAYAQISDVKAKAQIPIAVDSRPSEGEVQGFLEEVEAELNAILTNIGYVTPVASTAAQARILLRDITAQGALGKTLMSRAVGTDASLLEVAKSVQKEYRARVADLRQANDPFWLPDAERTDQAAVKLPNERSASFVDDPTLDDHDDARRITRAQRW